MDFGIAIMTGGKRLTATGTNIGTACYMSPEHIQKPKDIDHRSDVYAMGILLYEMLTGDVPFDGETEYEVKNQHINAQVPDPAQYNKKISQRLSNIILKALEKDPDNRFSGCGEFLEYIEAYEIGDISPPPPPPIPNGRKKSGWIWAVIVLILLFSAIPIYKLIFPPPASCYC